MGRILSRQELVDMCTGAAVLGTGGGGGPEFGINMLEAVLAAGKQVEMVSLDEIPDDALVVCPAGIGSGTPTEDEEIIRKREVSRQKLLSGSDEENPYLIGLKMLEKYMGKKAYASIAVETGGYSIAVGAMVAAYKGIRFVDADPIGRSTPEVEQESFTVFGVPATPFAVTDAWGNSILALSVASDRAAEQIARAMAVIGTGASMVGRTTSGKTLKKPVVIPGTASKSINIGQALREAKERGDNVPEAVINAAEGKEFFHGVVEDFQCEDRGGFNWATNEMAGVGKYDGRKCKIWIKNENLISWLDGEPHVVCPDLICVLDAHTGEPVTNSNIKVGMELIVFGVPSHPIWRTQKGLEVLSPGHFGFDIPYRPIEDIL